MCPPHSDCFFGGRALAKALIFDPLGLCHVKTIGKSRLQTHFCWKTFQLRRLYGNPKNQLQWAFMATLAMGVNLLKYVNGTPLSDKKNYGIFSLTRLFPQNTL